MVNIKKLQAIIDSQPKVIENDNEVLLDINYVCNSGALIAQSLRQGNDVMQLANGDIIICEFKPVTFYYTWDEVKGKLVRVNKGGRLSNNVY